MNKIFSSIIVLSALLFTMVSCGDKLLTTEEVTQKVEEAYDAQIEGLEEELTEECQEKFDNLVVTLRDSILLTMEAEAE